MADSDEEEVPEEGEEGGDSPQEKQKKKQLFMAIGIVLGIVVIASVAYYFLSGPSEGEGEEKEEGKRVATPLTGYGKLMVEAIPDLEAIPYPSQATQKAKVVENATGDVSIIQKPVVQANGEVIYTQGDTTQVGERHTMAGVVVVDQITVQTGEANEKRVQARVHNLSGRFLADLRVDMLFLDNQGRILLARGVNPLVVSGGLFGDKIRTLKPGSSRLFSLDATDIPTGWTGSVSAQVTGYWFAP
ncbi:MAG: hypothetical protein HQL72_11600 [Magnetococcales bacterium]|nr:hypothetical protein [Magnetococcales bacterium]